MDARKLLEMQFDDAGYQLKKSLEGMNEATMDFKATATAMTPRETVVHLCDCYRAAIANAKGEKYAWGSFEPESRQTLALVDTFGGLRKRACDSMIGLPDETLINAHHYIVGHDCYHIGQICQARIACEPEWNVDSIYRF